jgi:hypothetical protein
MANEDIEYDAGTTSAEFLSRIPKKTDQDHIEDLKKMRALADKIGRNISLNPAIDLETAITNTKNLNEKETI